MRNTTRDHIWTSNYDYNFSILKENRCLNLFTERKVCKVVGSTAQFSPHWPVNVSQQLPRIKWGEAHGPQIHSGSAYQHYFLSDESARTVKSPPGQHSGERLRQSMPSVHLPVPVWELLWALQQGIPGLFHSEPECQ